MKKDISKALQFARDRLAPLGDENVRQPRFFVFLQIPTTHTHAHPSLGIESQPEFLQELEMTMSILAFSDPANSPISTLVDNRRQQLASQVNSAIQIGRAHV